jgi:hypothetical protein
MVDIKSNTVVDSSETTRALSVSLESGINFGGAGGATATATASLEDKVGHSMSQELSSQSSTGKETKVAFTADEMEARRVFAVWQWVATSELSTGQEIEVKSLDYSCTPDAKAPQYLPGSQEDLVACQKKATSVTNSVQNKPVIEAQSAQPPQFQQPTHDKGTTLTTGQFLSVGDYLVSDNGQFFAILQRPGNFCVYRVTGANGQHVFVWGSVQAAHYRPADGNYFVVMQSDGNFTEYKGTGPTDKRAFVWGSAQLARYQSANGQYSAVMQDNGKFCVYRQGSTSALFCS